MSSAVTCNVIFTKDREVLHPAPEGCAIKHRVVFYDGVQVLDAAPWQLQPGVPQLLEGSQHAPTDLLRWRVELGADCEVAVADVRCFFHGDGWSPRCLKSLEYYNWKID